MSTSRRSALSPENNLTYRAHTKVIFTTNASDYLFNPGYPRSNLVIGELLNMSPCFGSFLQYGKKLESFLFALDFF